MCAWLYWQWKLQPTSYPLSPSFCDTYFFFYSRNHNNRCSHKAKGLRQSRQPPAKCFIGPVAIYLTTISESLKSRLTTSGTEARNLDTKGARVRTSMWLASRQSSNLASSCKTRDSPLSLLQNNARRCDTCQTRRVTERERSWHFDRRLPSPRNVCASERHMLLSHGGEARNSAGSFSGYNILPLRSNQWDSYSFEMSFSSRQKATGDTFKRH